MFKLCMRFPMGKSFSDECLAYFYAKNNHHACEVAKQLLLKDNELATFYEFDYEGLEYDKMNWTIVAVNPNNEWSSQEILIAGLDYKTFEIINNCEKDPNDCDYDPNCDGVYPDSFMTGFWDRQLNELEKWQKYWGDLGNSLYCFHDEISKKFCVCVFIDGAGLLEGFGNNSDEALTDWKNKHGGWMKDENFEN